LPLQALANSNSHFHIGQRGSTPPGGPGEGLWLAQTWSFICMKEFCICANTLATPLSGSLGRGTPPPVLSPGVAIWGPIKGFTWVVFSCLHLIFIVSRVGWDGDMKRRWWKQ
jgi:hypothetical protein